MTTKKYLVKLIPHDKFFFGGERTFGENNQANYFVVSNYFPQQTGILGLMRHQLLLQCGDETIFKDNKIVKGNKVNNLIGEKSFTIDGGFNFGAIKSLSPVFICDSNTEDNDDRFYFPANKEYQWYEKLNDKCEKETVNEFLQIELKPYPLLKKYEAKFGLPDLLMNKYGELLKYEDIFKKHKQVGIRKQYEGGTDEKAYYIQTFYKLIQNFSFAFIVELDEKAGFLSQDVVVFGGEQQAFKMEVDVFSEGINDLIPNFEKSDNSDKVVLVSDAYVAQDIMNVCEFAITETVDFKFLVTTNSTTNYYSEPKKSDKYNLYKKGSVFYGDTGKITEILENKRFEKIGYNIYKTIKK